VMDKTGQFPIESLPHIIEGIDAGELVEMLRYNAPLTEEIARGFRLNKNVVQTPIVQQRLAKAAQRDASIAKMLVEMWRWNAPSCLLEDIAGKSAADITGVLPQMAKTFGGSQVWVALLSDDRKGVRKLAEKRKDELLAIARVAASPQPEPQPTSKVTRQPAPKAPPAAKTKELKEDLAAARDEQRRMKAQMAEAARLAEKNRQLADALHKELVDAKATSERLQRKLDREQQARQEAEQEASGLRKQAKKADKAPPTKSETATPSAPQAKTEIWPEAVTRLLNNRSYDAAIAFCEEILLLRPDNLQAHALMCRAYEETKAKDFAIRERLWLADRLIKAGKTPQAAEHVFGAFALDGTSAGALRRVQTLLGKLNTRDEAAMEAVRKEIQKLRLRSPEAYARLSDAAAKAGKDLHRALWSGVVTAKPSASLSLAGAGLLSASDIVAAINRNDELAVASVRKALDKMKVSNPTARKAFLTSVRAVDQTCVAALTDKTLPCVVDGSNVAFAHKSDSGKPRLNNILLIRKTLRDRGYFPVIIFADANLRYRIDQRGSVEKLIETEELLLVDSGTDADETILREAKRRDCPIITNDRMLDNDPENEVPKIRFDLDHETAVLIEGQSKLF
jgi:hypothetical protein